MRSIVVCVLIMHVPLSQSDVFVVVEEGGGIDAQAVYSNEGTPLKNDVQRCVVRTLLERTCL